jgi:hypothetical protein
MKLITNFVTAAVLAAGFNTAFAVDGRKEAVLDMGKGAFSLTVSAPADTEGPHDFGKNPGIGKKMQGEFQTQEVMFSKKIEKTTSVVNYKATAQKIEPSKNGQKLTAEQMAKDQIKANGFEGRAVKFDCPPGVFDGATSVCYNMSGNPIFNGKSSPEKSAAFLISVSWGNNTQGYTLMGKVIEDNVEKFNSEKAAYEKVAKSATAQLWNNHTLTNN